MSIEDGHSALHALHDRHKSSASATASSVNEPSVPPASASNRIRARPRVECISSRVAMYDGHIVPASVLRHLPMPTHLSAAPARPPSAPRSKWVSTERYDVRNLRCESMGNGSTRLPGFIIRSGS